MTELDESLLDWAARPGPARFLERLLRKLEQGGKATARLKFGKRPFTEAECRDLQQLLGQQPGTVAPTWVQLDRAERNLRQSRYHLGLQPLVELVYGQVVTSTERRDQERRRRTHETSKWRQDLLDVMLPVPDLKEEHRLFAELGSSESRRVPADSRTRAKSWQTYETAIRAAAFWWPLWNEGEMRHERTIAAEALGGSKSWTVPGRITFANLVGMPFDEAVTVTDTDVRVKGPISWHIDGTAADGTLADPWVAVPANGILNNGTIHTDAQGIFLIENKQTFEQVCSVPEVARDWLCIWNRGFASEGLIHVVRHFADLPVAAWCDLDPSGIKIVQDLMKRTGRDIRVVAMEPELWHRATKHRDKKDENRLRRQREALQLVETGPPALRELAAAIATTGHLVEQETETFCREVIPTLPERMRAALNA